MRHFSNLRTLLISNNKRIVFAVVAAGLLAGCSKGTDTATVTPPVTPPTLTVMGVAAAGLISHAKVSIYKNTDQANALKTMTTGANGVYSFDIPTDTGAVIIKVESTAPGTIPATTMLDERDGTSHPFTQPIRTALPVLVSGTNFAHATPFTEAMVKSIETNPTPGNMVAAKTIIMTITGADPVMTSPVHVTGASAVELAHTAIMADKLARLNSAAESDSTCGTAANATSALGDRLGCMAAKMGTAMVLSGATVTPDTVALNPILTNMRNITFAMPLHVKEVTMSAATTAAAPVDAPALSATTQASVDASVTQFATVTLVSVTAPTAAAMTGVATAKAFFNDFRAAGNVYSNAAKTGLLDKQGTRIRASTAIVPDVQAMNDVSSALQAGQLLYKEVIAGTWQANINNNLQTMDTDATGTVITSVRVSSWVSIWTGPFTQRQIHCRTSRFKGSVAADVIPANAGQPAVVNNTTGDSGSWDALGNYTQNAAVAIVPWEPASGFVVRCNGPEKTTFNPDGSQTVDYFEIVLTPAANWTAANGNFSYKSDKWQTINNANGSGSDTSLLSTVPYMSGTIASEPPATNSLTGSINFKGDFPSLTAGAYKESVDISFASTEAAATARADFNGSISTSDQTGGVLSSLGIGLGSYATAGVATSTLGVKTATPSSFHVILEAIVSGTKLTGTLDASAFRSDVNGINTKPTFASFTGTISDISTGGAGSFLTGNFEETIVDYNLFDSRWGMLTSTNYQKITDKFTGTATAPGQTPLVLVLSNAVTGLNSSTKTVNFTYATGKVITGTQSVANGISGDMVLTDTSSVKVTIPGVGLLPSDVRVGNELVGQINQGVITYTDLTVESVN